jgi:type II secretory pathway component PulM
MRLSGRERSAVVAAVGFLALLLVYLLVIAPLRTGTARLAQALEAEQAGYRRALDAERQIRMLRGNAGQGGMEQRLRALAVRQGLKESALSLRRAEPSVLELSAPGLSWPQIVGLLQALGEGAVPVSALRLQGNAGGSVTLTLRIPAPAAS